MNGAMFQMIAHGISSAGMFFMVGVIYDRVHHRNLDQFGGLFAKMPLYSGLAIGDFLRRLGSARAVRIHRRSVRDAVGLELQPGAGRDFGVGGDPYRRHTSCGRCSGFTWARNTRARTAIILPDDAARIGIAVPLLAFAILLGVYPQAVFRYMTPSVNRDRATIWPSGRKNVKQPGSSRRTEVGGSLAERR